MSTPPSCWVRRALEVSGLMTPRSARYPTLHRLWMGFNIASCLYCIVGSLLYFFLAEGAAIEKLQSVQISLTIFSGLLKLCNAWFQQDKVDSLLSRFDGLWDQLYEQPTNRTIMEKSQNRCKLLYKSYNYFVIIVPSLNATLTFAAYLLMGADKLAYQIISPFDTKKIFALSQAFQLVAVIPPFLGNSSSLFTYLTLSEQLATYMRVIRRKLREEKISRETITAHQEVIKLLNTINDLFSWLLYFEMNAVTIECSFSAYGLYKVHIKEGRRDNMVASLINFVFCYIIPYIICYCGSKISTESELLFQDAYNSMWYEHDIQSKKELRMVMLGASKILRLHYKNLAHFEMVLFLSIINMTYKFLNAILWLDKGE